MTTRQVLVLDAVAAGAHTTRQIVNATGLTYDAALYNLFALHTSGQVRRTTDPTGHKFLYFATAQAGK